MKFRCWLPALIYTRRLDQGTIVLIAAHARFYWATGLFNAKFGFLAAPAVKPGTQVLRAAREAQPLPNGKLMSDGEFRKLAVEHLLHKVYGALKVPKDASP